MRKWRQLAGNIDFGGMSASDTLTSGKPRPPPVETPLWKLQQGGRLASLQQSTGPTKEEIDKEKRLDEAAVANNLFDAASSSEGSGAKPLVRHVLIKDIRKVASSMKVELPVGGLFANRAPIALFAMFDGHPSGEDAGPLVAEWCARQAHVKLLTNLVALPADWANEKLIKDALYKSLEDLDNDLRANQQYNACGATVVLMVGDRVFTGVLGFCGAVLCVEEDNPNQSVHSIRSQQGRSQEPSTAATDGTVPRFSPDVRCFPISWAGNPFALLGSSPVMQRLSQSDMIKVAHEFTMKPRAIAGEIGALAAKSVPNDASHCTVVAIFFRPSKATEDAARAAEAFANQPASKRAKTSAETGSIRLRQILVKHKSCPVAQDPVRNKPVTRSEVEAETIVRGALRELMQETTKAPLGQRKAAAAISQPSPKFMKLCKDLSECATAKNGGGMLGDLGWLSEEKLRSFGVSFLESSRTLQVGQWSDVLRTEHGVHILQKIA